MGPKRPVKTLGVVRQQVFGHAVAAHGFGECVADRAGGGSRHDLRRDAEPGVVIEARDDRRFAAVFELHAAHDVHLPQLHGPGSLPALVVASLTATLRGLDQAVAHQRPVDRGAAGQGDDLLLGEEVADGLGSPGGVLTAQGADPGLDPGGHLMRAGGQLGAHERERTPCNR